MAFREKYICLFAVFIAAAFAVSVATVRCIIAIVGIGVKFAERELHFAEDRAGIVVIAGLGILFGKAEMASGKHKLNLAFHTNDRKYADSHIDVIRAYAVDKIAVIARTNGLGNGIYAHTAMSKGLAALDKLAVETDGRCDLNHNGGKSGLAVATEIVLVEAEAVVFGVRRENRNILFAAEEDDLFIERTQAFNLGNLAAAEAGFKRYAEIITNRYLIKALVEGHRLDVDVGVDYFDTLASDCACFIDNFLTNVTKVNAHILQAILVTRGIKNFINAYAAKLFLAVAAKSAKRTCSFIH